MAQDGGVGFNLIVRDRIVLHLLDNIRASEEFELPLSLTQDGIAEAVGVARSHAAQEVKNLIQAGHVEERMSHIQGGARRRKAYTLAPEGVDYTRELRSRLLLKIVDVNALDGEECEETLDAAWEIAGRDIPLLRVIQAIDDDGVLILDSLVESERERMDSPEQDGESSPAAYEDDSQSDESQEPSINCPSCGKESMPVISP